MFLPTTTGLVQWAPPSKEVCATIETPLPTFTPFLGMMPCRTLSPSAWPANR
jgi:hypothetical protein